MEAESCLGDFFPRISSEASELHLILKFHGDLLKETSLQARGVEKWTSLKFYQFTPEKLMELEKDPDGQQTFQGRSLSNFGGGGGGRVCFFLTTVNHHEQPPFNGIFVGTFSKHLLIDFGP